eukprot:tig00021462_g21596.t1
MGSSSNFSAEARAGSYWSTSAPSSSPQQPPGLASPVAGSQPASGAGASSCSPASASASASSTIHGQRALAIAGPERALSAERRRAAAADVLREVLAPRAPGPLPLQLPLSERAGADGAHPAPAAADDSSAPNSKPAKEKGAVSGGGDGWAGSRDGTADALSRPPDPLEGAAIVSSSDGEEDAEGSDEGPDPERVLAEIEEEIAAAAQAGSGAPAPSGDDCLGSCPRLELGAAPPPARAPREQLEPGPGPGGGTAVPVLAPCSAGSAPPGPSATAAADELLASGGAAAHGHAHAPRALADPSPPEARPAAPPSSDRLSLTGTAAGGNRRLRGGPERRPAPAAAPRFERGGAGDGTRGGGQDASLGRARRCGGGDAGVRARAPQRLLTLARCPSGPSGAPQAAAGPGPARTAAPAGADSPIVIDSDVEEGEEIEGGREPSGRCQGDREEEPRPWEPEPDGLVMFRVPPGGGAGDPDARDRSLADFLARNRPSRLTQAYAHWIYVHRMDARAAEGEPELRLKIQIAEAEFEAMCAAGAVAVEGLKALQLAAFSGLRTGKWVIWAPTRYARPTLPRPGIDDNWERVAGAVARGELGPSAKVAPRPADVDGQTLRYHAHVMCVYTPDLFDQAEVVRVREALRALGFQRKLVYKPDLYNYLDIERGNRWGIPMAIYSL